MFPKKYYIIHHPLCGYFVEYSLFSPFFGRVICSSYKLSKAVFLLNEARKLKL